VPSKADAAFVKRLRTSGTEIVLRTRNDALHGSHPWLKQTDFTSLRQALAPTIEAARKVAGAGSKSSAQAVAPSRSMPQKRRAQDPIIMLSNSPTSLITMFNVKTLLEDGIFIDPTEARMAANGVSESIVSVFHQSTNGPHDPNAKPVRFLVVDNADALSRLGGAGGQDIWTRVVAVFTTGQTWQFKSYRWTEPKDLFRHGEF
jgi:parafibromin